MPTRVIITGSRSWSPRDLVRSILVRLVTRFGEELVVVHGACETGIDAVGDELCGELGIAVERHPAAWDNIEHPQAVVRRHPDGRPYNANAGPIRNGEMVDLGAEFAIAMHQRLLFSKGTLDCVRRCLAADIPVYLEDGVNPTVRIREGDLRR
jgi:hypothetical protein